MLDSPLIRSARELAREAHAGQLRKAGGIPYFVHLERVAQLLEVHGYDDEVTIAAAYLHDLLEDQPAFAERMRAEMPPEVIETVAVLSEVKVDARGEKRPKGERFDGYLAQLRAGTEAARRAIPISCADKIDNTRSLVDAEREGQKLLMRMNTRPSEHEGQLARLRPVYAAVVHEALLASFDEAACALMETVSAWLRARAVAIAAEAHLGQYDKAGAPYIEHPLRLMMRAKTDEERMVAVLHDVVEDSDAWTLEALEREGFPRRVVRAVGHLTKRPGEDYARFIERVAEDRLATRIKLLDLEDNSDPSRLREDGEETRARMAKYRRAIERLRPEAEKRSLYVVLDEPSVSRVRALARHRELAGDHVTLAHGVSPEALSAAWIPGGHRVGDRVALRAIGEVTDARVQALVVELEGSTARPYDGGTLHVTVSFAPDARASESNGLIASAPLTPLTLPLSGEIRWVE